MKPAAFRYERPASVGEAVDLLAEHGPEARVLAGGQSLVPLLNQRVVRPTAVVDINALGELRQADCDAGVVRLGALVRHADLARGRPPVPGPLGRLLPEVAAQVGHEAIRSRGTFCGSLAHADPASEWAALALALDGIVITASPRGERRVAAADLATAPFATTLAADELVVAAEIPLPGPRTGLGFREMTRRTRDFALALAVVAVRSDGAGRLAEVRIALGGVGPTSRRATEAEAALVGVAVADRAPRTDAAHLAAEGLEPATDVHASADYRRRIVPALVLRALDDACAGADDAGDRQDGAA